MLMAKSSTKHLEDKQKGSSMNRELTRGLIKIFTTLFFIVVIAILGSVSLKHVVIDKPNNDISTTVLATSKITETIVTTIESTTETPTSKAKSPVDTAITLSEDEIKLISLVTMAEAEGEPELGKRLVIDTILNRVDSNRFPNTVHDVIYQPNQFTSVWNGRIDRCEIRDDIYQLVIEEAETRSNQHVIFFRTDYYHPYGTPMFSIGNHYFSEY